VLRETLAGMQPLLCSEDMEVQERAHNATALLSLILRKLNPTDPALIDSEPVQNDVTDILVQHEQSNGFDKDIADEINGEEVSPSFSGGLIEEFASLFEGELKPVAPKAQKKVPMPPE
ncbi:jg23514, partial [Pararge aegeria aegeria]